MRKNGKKIPERLVPGPQKFREKGKASIRHRILSPFYAESSRSSHYLTTIARYETVKFHFSSKKTHEYDTFDPNFGLHV